MKMVEILHKKKYGDEIWKIPLSNDTVTKKITEISNDLNIYYSFRRNKQYVKNGSIVSIRQIYL